MAPPRQDYGHDGHNQNPAIGQAIHAGNQANIAPKERTAAQVALQELENHLSNLRGLQERVEEVADHLGCSSRAQAQNVAAQPVRPVRVGIIGSLHSTTEECEGVLIQIQSSLTRIEGQV